MTLALRVGEGRLKLQSRGDAVSARGTRGRRGARGKLHRVAAGRERCGVGVQGQKKEIRRTGREKAGRKGK